MKKFTFILYVLSIIILGILGAWIGMYIYKINSIGNLEIPILEGMENKNLDYELALATSESEEKISPNAALITKVFYKNCNHTLKDFKQIDNKYVNMEKEEFEKSFLEDNPEYSKIESFSAKEVIAVKEITENCGQHYVLRENNNMITIYKLDENGKEQIYKNTNIDLNYLTEADKKVLKEGIKVIGNGELNSKLEDYV